MTKATFGPRRRIVVSAWRLVATRIRTGPAFDTRRDVHCAMMLADDCSRRRQAESIACGTSHEERLENARQYREAIPSKAILL